MPLKYTSPSAGGMDGLTDALGDKLGLTDGDGDIDGLTDGEIRSLIASNDASEAATLLVSSAVGKQNADNVTVVIAEIGA